MCRSEKALNSYVYSRPGDAGAARLSPVAGVAYARAVDTEPADSALMLRYRDGDVAAFERLYRRHNDALYRYMLRHCRDPATAEDLFQEVWGKIIKSRSTYRPTAKFTTFLYRVAYNCFIDHVRRDKRHAMPGAADPADQPDPAEPAELQVERSLARRRLDRALLELPDEQRDAFLLREELV